MPSLLKPKRTLRSRSFDPNDYVEDFEVVEHFGTPAYVPFTRPKTSEERYNDSLKTEKPLAKLNSFEKAMKAAEPVAPPPPKVEAPKADFGKYFSGLGAKVTKLETLLSDAAATLETATIDDIISLDVMRREAKEIQSMITNWKKELHRTAQ